MRYNKSKIEQLTHEVITTGQCDVRGLGLMLGVEFVESKATMNAAPELRDKIEIECFNRGLIILGCGGNTIRWSPPLILSKENADVALEIFDRAIAASI